MNQINQNKIKINLNFFPNTSNNQITEKNKILFKSDVSKHFYTRPQIPKGQPTNKLTQKKTKQNEARSNFIKFPNHTITLHSLTPIPLRTGAFN